MNSIKKTVFYVKEFNKTHKKIKWYLHKKRQGIYLGIRYKK